MYPSDGQRGSVGRMKSLEAFGADFGGAIASEQLVAEEQRNLRNDKVTSNQ